MLTALSASIALADDFKTIDGKEYKNATVSRVEPDGIVLKTKSGISKVYFTELPKEVQQRFNYEPNKAAEYSAQNVAAQNAATQKKSLNEGTRGGLDPFGSGWKQGYLAGQGAAYDQLAADDQLRIIAGRVVAGRERNLRLPTDEELNRKANAAAVASACTSAEEAVRYALGYRQGFEQSFRDKDAQLKGK